MKRLIVPIDFSKYAEKALLQAKHIALKVGCTITAVHVAPYAQNSFDLFSATDTNNLSEAQKNGLARSLFTEEEIELVDFHLETLHGPIVDSIVDYYQSSSADLLILASKGSEGLKAKLFGTNTGKIIQRCQGPVLVVPPSSFPKPFRNCLIGTNLTQGEEHALKGVFDIFDKLKAEVSFLHVRHEEKRSYTERMWDFKLWLKHNLNIESIEIHSLFAKTVLEGIHAFTQSKEVDCFAFIQNDKRAWTSFSRLVYHRKWPSMATYRY